MEIQYLYAEHMNIKARTFINLNVTESHLGHKNRWQYMNQWPILLSDRYYITCL